MMDFVNCPFSASFHIAFLMEHFSCDVQAPKPLLMCKRLNRHRNTKVTEISTDLDTGAPNVVVS